MKKIVLSNGVHVEAYVGDGFDGGSIVCFRPQNRATYEGDEVEIPRTRKDITRLRALLLWYVREEMKLRRHEGQYQFHFKKKLQVPELNESHPYRIIYLAGGLDDVLKQL